MLGDTVKNLAERDALPTEYEYYCNDEVSKVRKMIGQGISNIKSDIEKYRNTRNIMKEEVNRYLITDVSNIVYDYTMFGSTKSSEVEMYIFFDEYRTYVKGTDRYDLLLRCAPVEFKGKVYNKVIYKLISSIKEPKTVDDSARIHYINDRNGIECYAIYNDNCDEHEEEMINRETGENTLTKFVCGEIIDNI